MDIWKNVKGVTLNGRGSERVILGDFIKFVKILNFFENKLQIKWLKIITFENLMYELYFINCPRQTCKKNSKIKKNINNGW